MWGLAAALALVLLGGAGVAVGLLARSQAHLARALAAETEARKEQAAVAQMERQRRLDAERRVRAEGMLEAARRALHRLEIMRREPEEDKEEPEVVREALGWLEQVEEVYPDLGTTRLERGRLYALLGREEEAVQEFGAAIERSPDLAGARLERAAILAGWYENARHETEGPREETEQAAAWRRQVEEDIAAVERWSEQERDVEYGRGILAFAAGRYEEAVEPLGGYVRRDRGNAEAWTRLGHAQYHLERHEEAVAALTESIEQAPRYADAYFYRGLAREAQGDLAGAIADYDEAIRIDPRDAQAYVNRGLARAAQRDLAGAIEDFTGAIELRPRWGTPY